MTERIEWGVDPVPEDYFRFLQRINANWFGISVALNIEGSLDSTVERIYEGFISTFTDDALTIMIDALHQHGCNVYLTLAFETNGADDAEHPVKRWQLGDPNMAREDAKILPDPLHCLHPRALHCLRPSPFHRPRHPLRWIPSSSPIRAPTAPRFRALSPDSSSRLGTGTRLILFWASHYP